MFLCVIYTDRVLVQLKHRDSYHLITTYVVISVLKTMIFMRSSLMASTTTVFVHTTTSGDQTT